MLVEDPLIGRAAERAALDAAAERARAGRGSIVLVAGETGVGKTTLARTALAESGLELVEGFGVQEGASAYGPIVEVLRALLQPRPAADALEPALRSQLAVLLPELGPRAPAVDRATLFEAIRAVLALAAARRPAAVLLDDMQWADDATLDCCPRWRARSRPTRSCWWSPTGATTCRAVIRSGGCAASCAARSG